LQALDRGQQVGDVAEQRLAIDFQVTADAEVAAGGEGSDADVGGGVDRRSRDEAAVVLALPVCVCLRICSRAWICSSFQSPLRMMSLGSLRT
jgi:hypothetical protein